MSQINVTPLVDVMLVLLIIFMVTAPLMERQKRQKALEENLNRQQRLIELGLPLPPKDLPENPPPPDDEDQSRVVLKIQSNLELSLDQAWTCGPPKALDKCWKEMQSHIQKMPRAKTQGVAIDAHFKVPFGAVVQAIHYLRLAGIERVGMMPREISSVQTP